MLGAWQDQLDQIRALPEIDELPHRYIDYIHRQMMAAERAEDIQAFRDWQRARDDFL